MKHFLYLLFSFANLSCLTAQEWKSFFEIETLSPPVQRWVPSEMVAYSETKVAFSTNRGDIWIADYKDGFQQLKWQRFASGLRSPGRLELENDTIQVLQNDTIWTTLIDEDKDGVADRYMDQKKQLTDNSISSPFNKMRWLEAKPAAPFKGQYFGFSAGDQFLSRMIKVDTKTDQFYSKLILQDGFRFPIDGIIQLPDQSYIINLTNRTDLTRTRLRSIQQRLVWKASLASFEIETITASPDCFTINFTEPLNAETAEKDWSYNIQQLRTDQYKEVKIDKLKLNPDNLNEVSIYLTEPITPDTYYQLSCEAVWSTNRNPVRNPTALFIWKQDSTGR